MHRCIPVSYTHLDVYKRQTYARFQFWPKFNNDGADGKGLFGITPVSYTHLAEKDIETNERMGNAPRTARLLGYDPLQTGRCV